MTPDQRFTLLVRVAIGLFCVLFAYFVVADTYMPMTPEARVMRPVIRVSPEVSGPIQEVAVSNNQHVEAGDLLFRIDPEPFRLALEQAELNLENAHQENDQLAADLASARAELESSQARATEQRAERNRAERLISQGSISRQQLDSLVASDLEAQANLKAAQANIRRIEIELGAEGDANLRLRQAANAVARAKLDLVHTEVRAEHSGTLGNLQLQVGSFVTRGQPVLALVTDRLDLVADFREKSLRKVKAGDEAQVIFDGLPGRIYKAHVAARDAGVYDGQLAADGTLADIPTTDRWVRDAQRVRIHLELNDAAGILPPSGARATVQLLPGDHPLAHPFGKLQARLMSWLHYVY